MKRILKKTIWRKNMRNFLKGYGSILTISPTHKLPRIELKDFPKTDEEALRKDWESVGEDILYAMKTIGNETRK